MSNIRSSFKGGIAVIAVLAFWASPASSQNYTFNGGTLSGSGIPNPLNGGTLTVTGNCTVDVDWTLNNTIVNVQAGSSLNITTAGTDLTMNGVLMQGDWNGFNVNQGSVALNDCSIGTFADILVRAGAGAGVSVVNGVYYSATRMVDCNACNSVEVEYAYIFGITDGFFLQNANTLRITGGTVQSNRWGVFSDNTQNVDISNVVFNCGAGGSAGPAGATRAVVVGGGQNVNISGNTVNLFRVAAGIDVSGAPNTTVNANRVTIHSTGTGQMPPFCQGLTVANCTGANVSGNFVESQGNPFSFWSRGLSIANSPSSIVTDNTFSKVNYGTVVSGNCNGTLFERNIFAGQQQVGLFYSGVGSRLGNQFCAENLWIGTFSILGADAINTNDVFFVDLSNPIEYSSTNNLGFFLGGPECLRGNQVEERGQEPISDKGPEFFSGNFRMYPNPSKDMVTLLAPGASGDFVVEVKDLAGKLVIRQQTSIEDGDRIQLDIASLSDGLYMVSFFDGRHRYSEKLVVQR